MDAAADTTRTLYCRLAYDEPAGAAVLQARWMTHEEAERVYREELPSEPAYAGVATYTPAELIGSLSTLGAHALFALVAAPPGERGEVHRALVAEYANLVATVVDHAGAMAAQLPSVESDTG